MEMLILVFIILLVTPRTFPPPRHSLDLESLTVNSWMNFLVMKKFHYKVTDDCNDPIP